MALLIKIVLGIVLAGLLVAVAVWWWFRRLMKRGIQQALAASDLVRDFVQLQARLELYPAMGAPTAAFDALWDALQALGFQAMDDLCALPTFARLRAGSGPGGLTAVVTEGSGGCHYLLLALGEDQHLWAYSNGPEAPFQNARMRWSKTELAPADAIHALRAEIGERRLRELNPQSFRALFEAAYATRTDALLGQLPTRETLSAQLRAKHPAADPARLKQALIVVEAHWEVQLQLAVLDRFRRAQRLDPEAWEALQHDLQVVHDRLDRDSILHLLDLDAEDEHDPDTSALLEQGLPATELYQRLVARLPTERQPRLLGRVDRPLAALIYAAPEVTEAPAEQSFVYAARTADGSSTQGVTHAASTTAAKAQLRKQGLDEVQILMEPSPLSEDLPLIEPELASAAVRAARESVLLSLLRATWANAWLWAPPALLAAYSLYEGKPYGWGDYAVAVYAVLAGALLVGLIGPILFYHQLLRARMFGHWRLATFFLRLLELTAWLGAPSRTDLANEGAKIHAGRGDLKRALSLWEALRSKLSDAAYVSGLVTIYDAAGAHREMIEAQRRLLPQSPSPELPTVDLALALARYGTDVDEAERLLAEVNPEGLSELVRGGYHLVRGLILADRQQYVWAARQFQEAGACVQPFSMPLTQLMTAEAQGFCAWALKRAGRTEDAERLWATVAPLLEQVPGSRDLVQRYRSLQLVPNMSP